MTKRDAPWLLALPIYRIIGTARHEGSHALVALLHGATITEFRILPFVHPDRGDWQTGQVVASLRS
jgi:hypothetical protein